MEQLYSITQSGGKHLVKFATPPPEIITNELKRDKLCKWDVFRKHWSCTVDPQFIMKLERDLNERGWQRVQAVEAQKTTLSANATADEGNIVIKFNRKPDESVRKAISTLGSRDAREKTTWFVRHDAGNKQKLMETFAKFPNIQVTGLDISHTTNTVGDQVAFEMDGPTLKLHFQTPPAPNKVHRIKGALQMLGFTPTDNTLPVQNVDDESDDE